MFFDECPGFRGGKRANRGSIARRSRRLDWVGGESSLLDGLAHVREGRESGKASHGGHGGHGGWIGLVAKVLCWTGWLTCEKGANRGRHRTEDTEVTEAGLGWWRKFFAGRVGSRAEGAKNLAGRS
jgi:hypothetical protein